jgi:hypothetical protein
MGCRTHFSLAGRAHVLEPGEAVALVPTGGGHVQVAVAVDVGQGDVVSTRKVLGDDDVPLPGLVFPQLAGVLEPNDVAVQVLDHDHVRLAVAVDVADGQALEPAFLILGDVMAAEVAFAIVGVPGQGVARGVGADQIEVAVAVDVGHGQTVGVTIAVLDQVLAELGRGMLLGVRPGRATQPARQDQNGQQEPSKEGESPG